MLFMKQLNFMYFIRKSTYSDNCGKWPWDRLKSFFLGAIKRIFKENCKMRVPSYKFCPDYRQYFGNFKPLKSIPGALSNF